MHNEVELQKFITDRDKPGWATYHTVARLKAGTTRCKENVEAVHWAFSELDFKDHPDMTPEEIFRRVQAMPSPPTLVIMSGHGLHLYWKFNEALDAAPGKAQQDFEDALKLACAYVGGDSSATEAARLLRLPGSHNTKFGDNILVSIIANTGHSYELSDLVDFWLEAQPIMPEPVKTNGHNGSTDDYKDDDSVPVDVEARLRDMRWLGKGNNAIHPTQLHCTGSMLRSGLSVEVAVAEILASTRKAVAGDSNAAHWDWTEEQRGIEEMCYSLVNKDHTLLDRLPDELRIKFEDALAHGKHAKISRNRSGWHVRTYPGQAEHEQTSEDPGSNKPGEAKNSPPPKSRNSNCCATATCAREWGTRIIGWTSYYPWKAWPWCGASSNV